MVFTTRLIGEKSRWAPESCQVVDGEDTQRPAQPGGQGWEADRRVPETSNRTLPQLPRPSPPGHSPFSSSAAKKAARQSSRVMTGPQNQLGVQDTTNLWGQKRGGGCDQGLSKGKSRGPVG